MGNFVLGFGAAFAAAVIGAGWQIVTRFGVTTSVSAYDLALIRYLVPALILSPILFRHGILPSGLRPGLFLLIFVGGGLPFGLLVMLGAQYAPVSHIAVLIPGMMPIFVVGLAHVFLNEAVTQNKAFGAFLMLVGVGCIGWDAIASMGPQTVFGDALLVLAAFMWAAYTIAFRLSGLDPWHAAALICFWSALAVLPLWWVMGGQQLFNAPLSHVAIQILWQGILAGAVGLWVYGFAMQKIGAAQSASVGAIVPALAGIGGWLVLGEMPNAFAQVGILVTVAGVVAMNLSLRSSGPGN